MEHFDELRVAVIYDAAVSHIQCIDLSHFLFGEGEVPDIKVLFHAVPVNALGNDHYTPLDIPAQGHLSGGLAVGAADLCENGVCEDAELTLRKGPQAWGITP